ncbi:STM4014 family protein [Deinococcus cellulosilyticus]|uniref:ATP-grasp domain-containing protein n=1 Tax=Deinococcus cellulosilyticus (strain DSM 18568 / NBRC 106333 / KACC 11606 / 5516J-15) TaxID=1223518 RepID=A0A511N3U2_DEIC1|nr:STM4014 family protein [Deinococcus cellulosilyticus]GEM47502.1 hypothetical protein DC3_31370 [Deinococcus cellulosilyticus NBRC 106333 = KACC 11606]
MRLSPRPVLIIAPPDSRRVRAFQASLRHLGWPEATVVSHLDIIGQKVDLARLVPEGGVVRVEASGECMHTERALLKLGQESTEAPYDVVADVESLDLEKGRIPPSRQWYQGLKAFFDLLDTQLRDAPAHQKTLDFPEALELFDKRITSQKWDDAGLPVPQRLPEPRSFDELLEHMRASGLFRVFIKLAHGSSASGALALQVSGRKIRAVSTVEREQGRLYNSRKLLHYDQWSDIRSIMDLLCRHPLQVEAWVPKASFQGKLIDLRVVVIGQTPMQRMVRLGQGPMTNLHLGNDRGDLEALKALLGDHWDSIEQTCQRAMQVFPKTLYAGLDVLVRPSLRQHALLEGNAFGDYHRNVFWQGMDTFTAELFKLQEMQPC